MKTSIKNIFERKSNIKMIITLVLLAVTAVMMIIVKSSPFVAEYVFARGIFKVLSVPIAFVSGLLPFSIAEIGIAAFIINGIAWTIYFFINLAKFVFKKYDNKRDRWIGSLGYFYKGFSNAALTVSILLFTFCIFCGVNYYRYDFEEFCDFEVREYTTDELYRLCVFLANETNNARNSIESTDKNGIMVLEDSFYDTANKAGEAMRDLSKEHESINFIAGRAKPVLISKYMSYTGITGIYSPFTIEANVNNDMPDYNIPVTICHELAHLSGYMKEDEANYIAYLACVNSEYAEFQYSGYALAYIYASNQLYDADYEKFVEVAGLISDEVRVDFIADSEYWDSFEETEIGETIEDVSNEINDTYLNINGQEEGTKSYGMMVDLLIADFLNNEGK